MIVGGRNRSYRVDESNVATEPVLEVERRPAKLAFMRPLVAMRCLHLYTREWSELRVNRLRI